MVGTDDLLADMCVAGPDRVVVLPIAEGQTVYCLAIRCNECAYYDCGCSDDEAREKCQPYKIVERKFDYRMKDDVGKSVFLIQKAANAYLNARNTYHAYLSEAMAIGATPHTLESWCEFNAALAAKEGAEQ
jgi:hypothetical protein